MVFRRRSAARSVGIEKKEVRSRKNRSTMLSQEQLVGGEVHGKTPITAEPALDLGMFVR